MQTFFEFIRGKRPYLFNEAPTLSTLFCGGGIFDIGAEAAGFNSVWGMDIDPKTLSYYPFNGILYDLSEKRNTDIKKATDILHASPPCQSYSVANSKKESKLDVQFARSIVTYLHIFKYKVFTLENVPYYRNSEAWKIILNHLLLHGYSVHSKVIDFADWGIPQNRNRFIVVAIKKQLVEDYGDFYLRDSTFGRLSWFDACRDLIKNLPKSQLTNTQLKKLKIPERDRHLAHLIKRIQIRDQVVARSVLRPSWTVTATMCTDGRGSNRLKFADIYYPLTGDAFSVNTKILARLQSIPDWYTLPKENSLAGKIIGNGVPSYFAYQLYTMIKDQYF